MKVVTHKRLHSTCFIFNKTSRIGKSMAIEYKFMVLYGWGHRDPSRRSVQFSSVHLLSRVQLFATPRITACQASLSIANSQSLPKLMSIESVMPSNHLILCRSLLLLPSIFPNIMVFSNESDLRIGWPKY